MNAAQRSNWLATRLAIPGVLIAAAAAFLEYRPSDAGLPWRSYAEGLEEARAAGKPVYVDVFATWCGPCREMERTTFQDSSVRRMLTSKYIPVRIDIDTKQLADSLKASWNIRAVPTSLILSARGGTLARRVGYLDGRAMAGWLDDPAILAFAGWLDYAAARSRSRDQQRPLLVILTNGSENLDEIREFFTEPKFRSFLQERFIVTRLTGEGAEEQGQVAQLRGSVQFSPTAPGGITLIALDPSGRELGQVPLGQTEFQDQERVMKLLSTYLAAGARKVSAGNRRPRN